MPSIRRVACLASFLLLVARAAAAGGPVVPGFERYGRGASDPTGRVEAGLLLLGELGCVNCHAPTDAMAAHIEAKKGPVLDEVGRRLAPDWVARYLRNPHGVKPGTTMPDLLGGLPEADRDRTATAIAHFLASTGPFDETAFKDADKARPKEGDAIYERVGCAACHGSRKKPAEPLPDHVPLVDIGVKWSPQALEKFLADPFAVRPSSRMPAISLTNNERQHLAASLLGAAVAGGTASGVSGAAEPRFAVDASLVEPGRAAFTSLGCVQCHQMKAATTGPTTPSSARVVAKPLDQLTRPGAGCLSPTTAEGGHPRYGLDDAQRDSVTAALAWLRSTDAAGKPDRERSIDRMLTSLNCYACHSRAAPGLAPKGGVVPAVATVDEDGEPILKEAARDALFTTAIQELGDEGRVPPTLTGVGDKLRPEFLAEVLKKGGEDRGPYMHTRMPKWHGSFATSLAALLAEDPKTEIASPNFTGHDDAEIDEQGRHLVGSKALGCIKCHAFGGQKGQGQGVVDLLRMPKRLRHEWFLAYVADPQRFRAGTRMPAAWPEGKSFYPEVLDGTASAQIEAVWRYLAGPKPRQPVGAGNNPIELVPMDRPILYRNFIEGAGPRAIGVGYPEKVNLAWDAENFRLALVWRGPFIDAGRHWTGRGQGFQPPLGDDLVAPDAAAAIEVLADIDAAWPDAPRSRAARFGGYTLDRAGRPTLAWSLGGMTIEEGFEPTRVAGREVVRRTIRLRGRPDDGTVVFRAAVAATIEDAGDGWQRIDGRWRVRVGGAGVGPETRRTHDARTELRFPVVWSAGDTADIVEELSW